MIAPKEYSYEAFPESHEKAEGMITMQANRHAMGAMYVPDLEYARDDAGKPLHLQLLLPTADEPPAAPYPVVVYICGSAWHKQNVHALIPQLARLARRGFAVAMPAYRPSEEAPFPAQVIDSKDAIRFLAENAQTYQLDTNRFVLMGDSSGGHTALLTAYTADTGKLDRKRGGLPVTVCAVVDYYGPTDITKMNDAPCTMDHSGAETPEGYLIGKKNVLENPKLAARTVVMNQVTAARRLPATMILHGDKDRIVPFNQSVLLYEKLCKAEQEVSFYKLCDADHGGMAFWTQEIVDLVASFCFGNMPDLYIDSANLMR